MSQKKRPTLGKGLEALLGGAPQAVLEDPKAQPMNELSLDLIKPGRYQPRSHIEEAELQELTDSIRAQGVIQPIVVNENAQGHYEIIAGERRWRAARLAGLKTIPAVIKTLPDKVATAIALIENIQREDLTPLEEARALDRLSKEFGLTHQEVAESVGKSRTTVTNLLRLLTLPNAIRLLLEQKKIEMGHAKILLGLEKNQQFRVVDEIVQKSLTVRETEQFVARLNTPGSEKVASAPQVDPDIKRLEKKLSLTLSAPVKIDHHPKGKGKLVIYYHTLDELEGILAHIQ